MEYSTLLPLLESRGSLKMKVSVLLNQLSANLFHEKYKGIYTHLGNMLVLLTTYKVDAEGNLIFFQQQHKSPMTEKTLF